MEFDTVYTEFEEHTSMKGAFEEVINPLSKPLFTDTNTGAADNNIFSDTRTEKNISKGSWYNSAFRKQEDKSKVFLPINNNNK